MGRTIYLMGSLRDLEERRVSYRLEIKNLRENLRKTKLNRASLFMVMVVFIMVTLKMV